MASTGEHLILASASAARARLLAAAGISVTIEPAAIDEPAIRERFRTECRPPADCALALAEAKARWVSLRHPGALVVGADQILVCDRRWFDKPNTLDAAGDQLRALRGRTHVLETACCVASGGELLWHAASRPHLTMRDFGEAFLADYLAAEGPSLLGSVGAYRLEGRGVQLFERIDGDFFAILGLPLLELLAFLRTRSLLAA